MVMKITVKVGEGTDAFKRNGSRITGGLDVEKDKGGRPYRFFINLVDKLINEF